MRFVRPFWAAFLFAACLPGAAYAQQSAATLQSDLEVTYQRVLRTPSDRALNRHLIDVAIQLKDYDTAIGAVERLIFYEPNNPDLQLLAAHLYFEIKSYAAAAGYLKDALGLATLSPGQREEATALLARVDRQTQPSIWSLFAQAGARYQTNANVAPAIVGDIPTETPVPDWNAFGLGTIAFANPVSPHLILEGSTSGYYADQIKVDRLDLGFAEIQAGPRILFGESGVSFKPYGIAQGILLGGSPYQRALGGGAQIRWTFGEGWYVEPEFEYKNRFYYNSHNYPLATDQTGNLFSYAGVLHGEFSDNFSWTAKAGFNQNFAAADYQSYDQFTANLGLDIGFNVFSWENWTFAPYTRITYTDYKGIAPPEGPPADLNTIRHDFQWTVGTTLEIPILDYLKFGLQVEYTNNTSNLDRFIYQNLQVVGGPVARF